LLITIVPPQLPTAPDYSELKPTPPVPLPSRAKDDEGDPEGEGDKKGEGDGDKGHIPRNRLGC
jgi:hypothetical protein